ncbi:MAG: polysaccharide biosynthesis protein [Chloroflexaceae bacterium]|nr:polysaccharide biosynthesis protein [Chloroflexaceae bacterium]
MTSSNRSSRLGQQVAHAAMWNTLLAPLKTVTELFANLVILNTLTLPQVGLLRVVTSAAATLGVWGDLGIDRALPRFIPELEQDHGRAAVGRFMLLIYVVKIALLLVLSVVTLFLADAFIAYLLESVQNLSDRIDLLARHEVQQEIQNLASWLIFTVLILVALGSFFDGLMAFLISYFRQRAWNLIGMVGDVLQPTTAAFLVLSGYGVAGVLVALVITPLVSVALAGWQVLRSLRRVDTPVFADQPVSTALPPRLWRRFGVYTAISHVMNLSDYIISWQFAILLFNDLALAAIYSVGTAMVRMALGLLYRPLVGVQVPLFTRVRGGDANLPQTFAAIGRLLALILLPGGVGLMLLAREIILIQYPQFVDAALMVVLLTPALFLETFLSSSQIILQVYERYRLLLFSRAATLLVLPLMLWAVPTYGLVGAALSVGGGRVVVGLLAAVLAWRTFDLAYSWAFFGRVGLAALVMGLVVWLLKPWFGLSTIGSEVTERLLAVIPLLVLIAVSIVVFGVTLRLLGGLEPGDREWIRESRLPLRHWMTRFL